MQAMHCVHSVTFFRDIAMSELIMEGECICNRICCTIIQFITAFNRSLWGVLGLLSVL
jgi:hypothetical protein